LEKSAAAQSPLCLAQTVSQSPNDRTGADRDAQGVGSIDRMVDLEDMALAVCGGYGTTFEASGRVITF